MAEVKATFKPRDAWWTVLLVDPYAAHLVRLASHTRWISPNLITATAFGLGLTAAVCFLQGEWPWLVAGAVAYHVSFTLDCVDGKLARLQGRTSIFGAWLDYIFDRVRELVCTLALMGGQYLLTGDAVYLLVASIVIFLTMFRYLNELEMFKVRTQLRSDLAKAAHSASDGDATLPAAAFLDEIQVAQMAAGQQPADDTGDSRQVFDIQREFRSRFRRFMQFRTQLARHRLRPHLMSGIEFQMALFIVAPLTGAIIPVSLGAGVLLLGFEFALIYKFWLSTRDATSTLASLGRPTPGPGAPEDSNAEAVPSDTGSPAKA